MGFAPAENRYPPRIKCGAGFFGIMRYLRLPSRSAQARATDELAASLPGSVAQPPFSTKLACCQELTFFSSARFASAPVARWNLSTQMGASAAMTAELALLPAISLAVLPSV